MLRLRRFFTYLKIPYCIICNIISVTSTNYFTITAFKGWSKNNNWTIYYKKCYNTFNHYSYIIYCIIIWLYRHNRDICSQSTSKT